MPAQQETISQDREHERLDQHLIHGKRMVICEDEGLTLIQLRRAMTRAGLTIVGAVTSGKNGMEVILRERPDIVLMDVGMPATDDFEAIRCIREKYHPCIIMLTGYPNPEFRAKAATLGISEYLIKPVTSDVLIPFVIQALEQFRSWSRQQTVSAGMLESLNELSGRNGCR